MADLLYRYTKEALGIVNSFFRRTLMPSLPEVKADHPVSGHIASQVSRNDRPRFVTIKEDVYSSTYAVFQISRSKDMIKQFRATGELANNVSRILLVVGRQIIASSDDVKSPVGDSWFPIVALPYQHFGAWCQLSDVRGPRNGAVEYDSCFLDVEDRRKLIMQELIYPAGYDILISKGESVSNKIGEIYGKQIVEWVRNAHPFYDKSSLHCWPLAGKIRLTEKCGTFERFGQVFDRVVVRANKACEFVLKANDMVIYRQPINADVDTEILWGVYFVYPLYNEISFDFVPNDSNAADLSCSIERSELLLTNSIDDRPYIIPEMGLVLVDGQYYVKSEFYAESLADKKESNTSVIV